MPVPDEPAVAAIAPPGVSPDVYDEAYYLTNCSGFQQYLASHGRDLAPRLERALDLAQVRPGERVLDIGCGRGELLVQCALRGCEAVGIDYADAAVRLAREALDTFDDAVRSRVGVRRMDARRMDFGDAGFDVVFMTDVVEHLYPDELDQVMAEVRRVLRPGGRVLIHTAPNALLYGPVWRWYVRHVHRVVKAAAAALRWKDADYRDLMFPTDPEPPRSDYERAMHVNEHSPGQVARLLRRHGFVIRRMDFHDPDRPPAGPDPAWRLVDTVRFLRPLSYHRPLNRFFSNHIWALAARPD